MLTGPSSLLALPIFLPFGLPSSLPVTVFSCFSLDAPHGPSLLRPPPAAAAAGVFSLRMLHVRIFKQDTPQPGFRFRFLLLLLSLLSHPGSSVADHVLSCRFFSCSIPINKGVVFEWVVGFFAFDGEAGASCYAFDFDLP